MTTAAVMAQHNNRPWKDVFASIVREVYAEHREAGPIRPRHQKWFHGEEIVFDPNDGLEMKIRQRLAQEMRAALVGFGKQQHSAFSDKMKFRHGMVRSIQAVATVNAMSHGACRFGKMVEEKTKGGYESVAFFVTNGPVELDTSNPAGRYLRATDLNSTKPMFYGLAITEDRLEMAKGINLDRGDNGVLFMTADPAEALCNVSAISTGRPVELFRSMLIKPAPGGPVIPTPGIIMPAPSPRF
jgi:hypothetical protein